MNARRWALAALAGVALLFAACSSSPLAPGQLDHVDHHHHGSNTTTSTSTAAAASSSTTTTTAVATTCSIKGSSGQGQGAAGTITGTIVVTNAGSTPAR